MPVKIRSSGVRLDRLELVNARTMRQIGTRVRREIIDRTQSRHQDYKGIEFKPYHPSYRRWKEEYLGVPVNRVDLTLTGEMLREMGVLKETARTVVLGFRTASSAQKAIYHCLLGAGRSRKIRDFFAVTPAFLDIVAGEIRAFWNRKQ